MNSEARSNLYKHCGCDTATACGLTVGHYDQAYGLQAKVDKIVQQYEKHRPNASTQPAMLRQIKAEWTAGLGPIASALMWMAIRALARKVIIWLWNNYNR